MGNYVNFFEKADIGLDLRYAKLRNSDSFFYLFEGAIASIYCYRNLAWEYVLCHSCIVVFVY